MGKRKEILNAALILISKKMSREALLVFIQINVHCSLGTAHSKFQNGEDKTRNQKISLVKSRNLLSKFRYVTEKNRKETKTSYIIAEKTAGKT